MSLSLPTPHPQPSARPLHLEAVGVTDTGWRRQKNEDDLAVCPELGLFIVADGMGGHAAGEIAARAAVATMIAAVTADAAGPVGARPSRSSTPALLVSAIERANANIFAAAQEDAALHGMGTTVVAALVLGGRLAVAHAGDSRAYLARGRHLQRLTEDHNALSQCRAAGIDLAMMPGLARHAHGLTRAVGVKEVIEVETRLVQPEPGDILLLCSDGLTCVIDDREIAAILVGCSDLSVAADRLIARALEHGGPDNVTVVLVRWVG